MAPLVSNLSLTDAAIGVEAASPYDAPLWIVVGAVAAGWRAVHFSPEEVTPEDSPALASVRHLRELLAVLP